MDHINRLNNRKTQNTDELKNLDDTKTKLNGEIKEITEKKTAQIEQLKTRISDMSVEFAQMLKETLDNMKQKIKQANEKWESENDGAMLKRFEEYANPSKQS